MTHIFKNLAIGIVGAIIYAYVSIELMDGEFNPAYAGVMLMSPFLFNRKKKGIKCKVCDTFNNTLRIKCKNKLCEFPLYKIALADDIKNHKKKLERIKKNTKKCPYCAEEIKKDAIKCKHCMEMLNKE